LLVTREHHVGKHVDFHEGTSLDVDCCSPVRVAR